MEKKLNKKKVLIIGIMVLLAISYIMIELIQMARGEQVEIDDIPEIEISEGAIVDEEPPEEIDYINISNENKILSCYVLGEFENGQTLSTEEYLNVVYSALNNGYVDSNKDSFSENEINNIIYSIFNVKLSENKSINGLEYKNGKYELKKTDKQNIVLINSERGTAAGSVYIEYEIDGSTYIARLNTNTVTGEFYIQSIRKD